MKKVQKPEHLFEFSKSKSQNSPNEIKGLEQNSNFICNLASKTSTQGS